MQSPLFPGRGYIELGFAPEQCPVCGAKGKVFPRLSQQ
jgi:rubrerythrin